MLYVYSKYSVDCQHQELNGLHLIKCMLYLWSRFTFMANLSQIIFSVYTTLDDEIKFDSPRILCMLFSDSKHEHQFLLLIHI